MHAALTDLILEIDHKTRDELTGLGMAVAHARELSALGDDLVGHFVERCRSSGRSWSEIGDHLGVTRQAVQKRFAEAEPRRDRVQPAPSRPRREHRGKYKPLWTWLSSQTSSQSTVTFDDIERILGFPLPPSSRRHQPHWHSYDGSAVVRAIVDAGWRAQHVDLKRERVTFIRQ